MSIQEQLSITKDLEERERISNQFRQKGFYTKEEKDEAINKVMELRKADVVVNSIATAENSKGSVPPEYATDEMVFNEINKQIDYLSAKLINEVGRNEG